MLGHIRLGLVIGLAGRGSSESVNAVRNGRTDLCTLSSRERVFYHLFTLHECPPWWLGVFDDQVLTSDYDLNSASAFTKPPHTTLFLTRNIFDVVLVHVFSLNNFAYAFDVFLF